MVDSARAEFCEGVRLRIHNSVTHVRNWSYEERELRANLVYRDFTRVGAEKIPGAKTMGRWAWCLGLSEQFTSAL
jgi:hypothetical protein